MPLELISADGLAHNSQLTTADQVWRGITCALEAWLEWTYLRGSNLLLRQQPLEWSAPILVD